MAIPEGEPGLGQQPACSPTAAGSARDRPQRSNEPANCRNHEEDLEDAEDTAAVLEWKARDAAGQTTFVPASEARLGMPR